MSKPEVSKHVNFYCFDAQLSPYRGKAAENIVGLETYYACSFRHHIHFGWIIATFLMKSLSLRDYAKWFCAHPVNCVNTMTLGVTWNDSSCYSYYKTNLDLVWDFAKRLALRDALTSVFLAPISCHVMIGAVLQNPIPTHLEYNVSKIYLWYWLAISIQISYWAGHELILLSAIVLSWNVSKAWNNLVTTRQHTISCFVMFHLHALYFWEHETVT